MNTKITLLLLALTLFGIASRAQSVSNGGFEDSTFTVNDTIPTHWSAEYFGFAFTSDAHSGFSAASIWNWYSYAKGWLVYGDAIDPYHGGGLPISVNPEDLTGYYKYIYDDNGGAADSAICEILLYSHQGFTGARDTIAHVIHKLGPVAEYTQFQVPITYRIQGMLADTIVIRFLSSEGGLCNPSMECLYLYLDDLEINDVVGTTPIEALMPSVSLYPSPAADGFAVMVRDVRAYPLQLQLYDLLGHAVFATEIAAPSASKLDPQLPTGNYIWQVTGGNGSRASGKLRIGY